MAKCAVCLPQDDRLAGQRLIVVLVVLIDDLVVIDARGTHAAFEPTVPAAINVASEVKLLSPSVIDGHLIVPQVDALWSEAVIDAIAIGSE